MRTTAKMGLTSWDQPTDPYNYAQLAGNFQILDTHDHSPSRGVPIPAGGLAAGAVLSTSIAAGVVGLQHLSTTLQQYLGLGTTGRGAVNIAAAGTTASASYTKITTGGVADQVTGIVLNTNGFIEVDYHALWKVSAGNANAVIMLNNGGGDQAVTNGLTVNGAPAIVPANTTQTHLSPLYTAGNVLATSNSTTTDASEVTTGESIGQGTVKIYAAAGTYTVSIQFQAVGGATITVQNRRLWVRSVNF